MDDKSQRRLILSLLVTIFIFVAEVVGGIMSHSLSLLSDDGHVLTDAFALAALPHTFVQKITLGC